MAPVFAPVSHIKALQEHLCRYLGTAKLEGFEEVQFVNTPAANGLKHKIFIGTLSRDRVYAYLTLPNQHSVPKRLPISFYRERGFGNKIKVSRPVVRRSVKLVEPFSSIAPQDQIFETEGSNLDGSTLNVARYVEACFIMKGMTTGMRADLRLTFNGTEQAVRQMRAVRKAKQARDKSSETSTTPEDYCSKPSKKNLFDTQDIIPRVNLTVLFCTPALTSTVVPDTTTSNFYLKFYAHRRKEIQYNLAAIEKRLKTVAEKNLAFDAGVTYCRRMVKEHNEKAEERLLDLGYHDAELNLLETHILGIEEVLDKCAEGIASL